MLRLSEMAAPPATESSDALEEEEEEEQPPLGGASVVAGRYILRGTLGRGGMSTVFRAEEVGSGAPVALKIMGTSGEDDDETRRRFMREAGILASIRHPNVVALYGFGKATVGEDEVFYMAMELAEGETLAAILRRDGPMPALRAIDTFHQIVTALACAHRQGIVHRDLKPANVVLSRDEHGRSMVKVLDFGVGKILGDARQALTREGSLLGSPRYMSPEQVLGGPIDARADLYAVGIMLYEALSGRLPFPTGPLTATLLAHCNSPVPPMRERTPDVAVPDALERLARWCLEKSPEKRPPSAEAVLGVLDACAHSLRRPPPPVPAWAEAQTAPETATAPRRRAVPTSWLVALALVVGVFAVLGAALCVAHI
jgi:serine/threonine-protein kinase